MARTLNPKRRRELRERLEAIARNPSTQSEIGKVRTVFSNPKLGVQWGRSNLRRGVLAEGMPTFPKPKRRKAVKPAVHVNAKDVTFLPAPSLLPTEYGPLATPKPKPVKRQGNKVVVKGRKMWSNT